MIPHVQMSDRFRRIVVLSTIWILATYAAAQNAPAAGFISVDCGNNATEYRDSLTGLTWETDEKYTLAGKNGIVPDPPNSSIDNYEALRSFRYFPESQSKYCYDLQNGSDYGFNDSLEDLNTPKVSEGIFFLSPAWSADEEIVYVCLVPDTGVPFISSLELRQFNSDMYTLTNQTTEGLYLSRLVRYNIGAADNARTVRYPDDAYDRFWDNPGDFYISEDHASQVNATKPSSPSSNNVPVRVMMDADVLRSGNNLSNNTLFLPLDKNSSIYAIFYCEALGEDSGSNMNMTILLKDDKGDLINASNFFFVTNTTAMKTFRHSFVPTNNISISIGMEGSSRDSQIQATINAMEIYGVNDFTAQRSSGDDVEMFNFLKTTFNFNEWQGDPCFPVPYNEITCEFENYQTGGATFRIQTLSITQSRIDDATFQFIIANFTGNSGGQRRGSYSLDLSHNDIHSFPYASLRGQIESGLVPSSIDLSYNSFSGEMPSFSTFEFTEFLIIQELSFSYNALTSLPNYWGNSSQGLLSLTILDLSHNSISSNVSSNHGISELVRRNPNLEEIYLSDNMLTGVFPGDLYFSKQKLPSLKSMNADRNNISGILDLSIWYQQLQEVENCTCVIVQQAQNCTCFTSESSLDYQVYSFLDNDISDIKPSADELQPLIDFLMRSNPRFNQSGILLGGNPYCKSGKSFTQRYLCRSSVNETVYGDNNKKNLLRIILPTTIGGSLLILLVTSIISVVIWRGRKERRELSKQLLIAAKQLEEIQLALTKKNAFPRFYDYSELKTATGDFHEDNKLGAGAFGAVYKANLSDGSTVAVKKLFDSEKHQVLDEFLNEVVLISGIKHKNLLQLLGCCTNDNERILIYEFANNGNLAEVLFVNDLDQEVEDEILDWTRRVKIAVGVAGGLSYLHEELQPRIIHRDIKAVYVLLDDNYNAKIADFGLAKPFAEGETHADFTAPLGTWGYFAPEYATEGQLTVKADVFSFGVLLLEIVTGKKCLDRTLPPHQWHIKNRAEDCQKSGTLLELLQPGLRRTVADSEFIRVVNIALLCVHTNPKLRPTMPQVVFMLLGNVDAQNFERDGGSNYEGGDIMTDIDSFEEDKSLDIFDEDSEEIPFARSRTFPLSSTVGTSRSDRGLTR